MVLGLVAIPRVVYYLERATAAAALLDGELLGIVIRPGGHSTSSL